MDIEKIVLDMLKKFMNVDKFDENKDIFEYGIDSIDFVKIIIGLENVFGISFDGEYLDYNDLVTVKNIISYIEKEKGNEAVF